MIDKLFVLDVIDKSLSGSDKFLVDLKITTDNRINVFIDGDNGVDIDDCVALSRAIENSLDRDQEDFELSVSSAGIDHPLKLKRQYRKNIGRDMIINTFDGETIEGKLLDCDNDKIVIKLPGKKNVEVQPLQIKFEDINNAKVVISF